MLARETSKVLLEVKESLLINLLYYFYLTQYDMTG